MRKMKDSGVEWIGEIPEGWEVSSINFEFVNLDYKRLPVSAENRSCSEIMYDYYGASGVIDKINDYIFDEQLILIGEDGANLLLRNLPLVYIGKGKYWVNNHAHVLKPLSHNDLTYMAYQLELVELNEFLTGATQPKLTQSNLAKIPVICPSLSLQQSIVNFLNKKCAQIDAILSTIQQSIDKLKEYRQAVITRAVTKGLDYDAKMKDSGIIYIDEISSKFTIQRLKNLLSTPLQYGANESGMPYTEGLPRYIRITDIDLDGNLIDSDKQSLPREQAVNYLLKDGDILFARSGATVGKTFMYKEDMGESCFAGYLIRATLKNYILPKFIYYYTQSSCYEDWKTFTFSQSTIQNINAEKYSSILLPLPQHHDQKNIVTYLDHKCAQIDALIAEKQKLYDKFTTYKKSLIYEYVTGKREVPDGWTE